MTPEIEPKWIPYCGDPECEHVFTVGPPSACVKCGALEKPSILEAKAWWPRENPTNDDILNAFTAGWKIGHEYKNTEPKPFRVKVKSEYDRDFSEEELAEVTERARRQSLVPKNWLWVEAYRELARAADRLHAMTRRSEEDAPAHTKDAP